MIEQIFQPELMNKILAILRQQQGQGYELLVIFLQVS